MSMSSKMFSATNNKMKQKRTQWTVAGRTLSFCALMVFIMLQNLAIISALDANKSKEIGDASSFQQQDIEGKKCNTEGLIFGITLNSKHG